MSEITKEWFEKRAAAEGDLEIGAGKLPTYIPGFVPSEADRYYNGVIAGLHNRIIELEAALSRPYIGHEAGEPVAIGWPKIMYVCQRCYENAPEMCGKDRTDISVMPDGRWICNDCTHEEYDGDTVLPDAPLLYAAPQPAGEPVVRPLRWKGPDSSGEYHSLDGLWGYIIRAETGNGFWLTEIGAYFDTVESAKAAAQADYTRCILSALSHPLAESGKATPADPAPQDHEETFEGSIDTDTPLQAAAREAGWALTTLVDISDWQRRQQLSDIIGRLAAALLDGDTKAPQVSPPLHTFESAPKDGTWFLAYRGPAACGTWDRYVIVRWHEEFDDFIWPDEAFDILADDIDEQREDGRFKQSPYEACGSFTHWSPLPVVSDAAQAPAVKAMGETETDFHIEWIAAARPPVHPNAMTGKAWFKTFDRALKHMKSQAADAQFVSITEHVTTVVKVDRSNEFRAALAASEGSADE